MSCVGVEITNDLENPSRTYTATDEVKKEMMQVCTIFISSVGRAFSCVALKSNNQATEKKDDTEDMWNISFYHATFYDKG